MDIKEEVNKLASTAKRAKEEWLAHSRDIDITSSEADLQMYGHVYADGDLKLVITTRELMPMMEALSILVAAYEAEAVALVVETWQAATEEALGVNPETGEPWKDHEMEAYMVKHGRGNGVIRDGINVLAIDKDDNVAHTELPYDYDENGNVSWIVDPTLHGLMESDIRSHHAINALRSVLETRTTLRDRDEHGLIESVDGVLGPEARLFHQHKIGIETCYDRGLITGAFVVAPPGSIEGDYWKGQEEG